MSGNPSSDGQGWSTRRVLLVVASLAVGATLILLGNIVQFGTFHADETTGSFWAAVFVNLGTTAVLAGVLVWFERRITQSATVASRATAKDEAERVVEEAVTPLRTDISDLNDLLRDRRNARAERHQELADSIATEGSMQPILELLQEATRRGAIPPARDDHDNDVDDTGEITVRAGDSPDSPFITFRGFTARVSDGFVVYAQGLEDTFLWWKDDAPAGEIVDSLVMKMVDNDQGRESRALDAAALFRNLGSALHDALMARDGNPEAWIKNTPVREVFADGWAVTGNGIEVRGQDGPVARDFQFSHWSSSSSRSARLVATDLGPVPPGLDADLWALAAERGSRYFKARPLGR